jgi:phosphatidylserine/phosphatidylglycerophosphate/cardiolipin synthase-like enzyme
VREQHTTRRFQKQEGVCNLIVKNARFNASGAYATCEYLGQHPCGGGIESNNLLLLTHRLLIFTPVYPPNFLSPSTYLIGTSMHRTSTIIAAFAILFCSHNAFGQASITGIRIPDAIAESGGAGTTGYPYAIFVRIQNWSSGASSQAYLKLYNGGNNEYMWSATGVWSNTTTYSNTNQPVVNIDASGNWSGWIYAKHNNNLGATAAIRAAKVGATSTNLTSVTKTFNILTMSVSGTGGWIFRQTSPAVNKGIVAYSGGLMVGTYRTEDNSIVEGYSYGAGGFKIAVPAGFVDSLVCFNDDGTEFTSFVGPWPITAGQETDAGQSGGQIGRGSALLSPTTISGGVSHSLSLKLGGESPYTITNARFAVPSLWTWSHSTGDIVLVGGGSPALSIEGDTIVVGNMSVGSTDSLLVQMSNFTPYDSTANFVFNTQTGVAPDSIYPISSQPSIFVYSTPLAIGVVKENDANGVPLLNNQLVTVRGIVTVANEFGGPSYIQDNSGGLGVFGSTFSTAVNIGDEVIVSGLVQTFSGLCEIVNPMLHSTVSTGNTVDPQLATATQIANDGVGGVEVYEGRLVLLNNVSIGNPTPTWQYQNYVLNDGTGSTEVRIDNNTNLIGQPIPPGGFDLVGVVGQFISNPPFIGGYQVMPRSTDDVISSGPIFTSFPVESNILTNSLTISWQTLYSGSTKVRYGRTPSFELGVVGTDTLSTDHVVVLNGLDPATVYYIKAFSVAAPDTSSASPLIASTSAPAQATEQVNVYFNHSVDTSLAWYQPANGNQDLVTKLVPHFNNAQRSIDVALYSLSGTPGTTIAAALVNAKNRGIKVRVICEDDNRNTAPFNTIASNGIPLITDRFDPHNNGAGLMHNKFMVVDGRGGSFDSVWVWTGSWNPTDPGTNNDFQNSIELQDPALANAYTLEFNEMWGSDTDVPNASNSRFGARKTNNTPHRFVIGGKNIECYFSPSDGANAHIISTVNAAEHSIGFQLLTLTRSDIASAIVAKKLAGVAVRGDLDNGTDQGSQYTYLLSNGVDVHLKTGASGLLHHKYGIFDAEYPLWNAVTITGSHNWTSSAENSNNENMLIVRDGNIANQYLQEFAARYYQFGGIDTILVGVEQAGTNIPGTFSLSQNYPNPFNPTTRIEYSIPLAEIVLVKLYDVLGREVQTLVNSRQAAGTYRVEINAGGLASGVYFYRLVAGNYIQQKKMLLLK